MERKSFYEISHELDIEKINNAEVFKKNNKNKIRRKNLFAGFEYFNLGFNIASPIIFLFIFGIFLDKMYNMHSRCTLIFIIIGGIASIGNLIRIIKETKY